MKTTRQIINQTPKFDINNTKEKLDYHFNTKWYSEEELRKIICYQKVDKDKGLVDGLPNKYIRYILKRFFGDNAPDLNSRSSDEL